MCCDDARNLFIIRFLSNVLESFNFLVLCVSIQNVIVRVYKQKNIKLLFFLVPLQVHLIFNCRKKSHFLFMPLQE
jgi:hypothetical protein